MSDPTPPRATLEEALADAEWDYVMHGAIYVVQHTDGTHQRLDPIRVRHVCRRCLGHGTIPDPDPNALDYGYRHPLPCPNCSQCRDLERHPSGRCDGSCFTLHPVDD